MKKVTGIGGIFFKCANPGKMKEWYVQHLGLPVSQHGIMFENRELENPDNVAITIWNAVPQNTKYFEPSKSNFMINYRVENLDALIEELRSAGVTIVDEVATYDYGKFVHVLDPEGNNIELWEPA